LLSSETAWPTLGLCAMHIHVELHLCGARVIQMAFVA